MIKLAFLIDPIERLNVVHDSSVGMIAASIKLGFEVYFFEATDLFLKANTAYAHVTPIHDCDLDASPWYRSGNKAALALSNFNAIIVRKDPPFDIDYVFMTYLLELAQKEGVYVTNPPKALRDFNEKLVLFNFPHLIPETWVSSKKQDLAAFWQDHEEIILKPLDGMGGKNVFHLRKQDPNFNVACEVLTEQGTRPIMAQKYLPEIQQGDRRIILFYGEPVEKVVVRLAAKGETRANIAAGGRFIIEDLSEHDRYLCAEIKPFLQQEQLSLVGLDVIGSYITEINITSPTMLRELSIALGRDVCLEYIDLLGKIIKK